MILLYVIVAVQPQQNTITNKIRATKSKYKPFINTQDDDLVSDN